MVTGEGQMSLESILQKIVEDADCEDHDYIIHGHKAESSVDPEVAVMDLLNKFVDFRTAYELTIGSLVEWAPGLDPLSFPGLGVPMVIVEKLEKPSITMAENGTPWTITYDAIVGVRTSSGLFATMMIDTRRVRPYTGVMPSKN
jgi:hypothetical protein